MGDDGRAAALAERLLAAHTTSTADHSTRNFRVGPPLVLPNAWDVASARAVSDAGFTAIATSSRAIAQIFGETDDDSSAPDMVFDFLRRIAAAVDVPVTADLQAGLHLVPAELVDRMIRAGVSGCNLEDSIHNGEGVLVEPEDQARYLSAVRAAADDRGVHLVINARIDSIIRGVGESPEAQVDDVIERARIYLDAGADCVYPMGHLDTSTIDALVGAIDGPVNVMATPGGPSIGDLAALGVARISFGSGLHSMLGEYHAALFRGIADHGEFPPAG